MCLLLLCAVAPVAHFAYHEGLSMKCSVLVSNAVRSKQMRPHTCIPSQHSHHLSCTTSSSHTSTHIQYLSPLQHPAHSHSLICSSFPSQCSRMARERKCCEFNPLHFASLTFFPSQHPQMARERKWCEFNPLHFDVEGIWGPRVSCSPAW